MKFNLLSCIVTTVPLPQKRSCGDGTNGEKEIAVSWPTDSNGGKGSAHEKTGYCNSPLSLFKNTGNHLDGHILSFHTRLCHTGGKLYGI